MYLLNCARVPFLIFLAVGRGLTMFMFSKLVSNWWIWQGNMESKALLASKIFRTYIHMYAWIFVLQVMLYVFLPSRSCRVLISQKGVPQITRYMYSTAYVFCPHYSGKKTENATFTITVHLDLCLRKTRVGKSHQLRDAIVLEKLFFKKRFPSTLKRKFLLFEKRFRNALFLWRSSVDGRLACRKNSRV